MGAIHVVVVTGLSGAGRSTAVHVLEDLGFFCVDNLPPALAPKLVEMLAGEAEDDQGSPKASADHPGGVRVEGAGGPRISEQEITRVGLGIDVRTGAFLEGADEMFAALAQAGHDVEVLFLDASDEMLVRRFSETRRPHPLAPGGDVLSGIQRERERMAPLKARARHVIDTTGMSVHDLRRTLVDYVARGGAQRHMVTRIVSFGFKYGIPVDADLVFDLRYLPNPHFVPELKPLTGLDERVARFVLDAAETGELLDDVTDLLAKVLPRYEREGKSYLTVAIGCTGGRHRSVAVAEELARRLRGEREIVVAHRDAER